MATRGVSRIVPVLLFLSIPMMMDLANGDSWDLSRTTFGNAMATFYGGNDASGTYGGACGYENPYQTGYGVQTAALSNALYNHGLSCGACFQIRCRRTATAYAQKWCYAGSPSIYITATNQCPPGSSGSWCDPPKIHFDLTYPAFTRLANQVAGVIPIEYRRVMCRRQGGIKFTLKGNPYWNLVLVTNVAGAGNVVNMAMKGSKSGVWRPMRQNWGQNWDVFVQLTGQHLSFRVTTGLGKTVIFYQVAPSYWMFGRTYQSPYNIY